MFRPNASQGLLIPEVSISHKTTHHSRLDSSGRVISSSQRHLPNNTHNTHNRQTSMTPARFEPTISAGERPQTYALDRATTGIGFTRIRERIFSTPEYFSHSESNFSLRYPKPCFLPSISFCEILSVITSIRLRDIFHLNKGTQQNHPNHKNTFKSSDKLQQK